MCLRNRRRVVELDGTIGDLNDEDKPNKEPGIHDGLQRRLNQGSELGQFRNQVSRELYWTGWSLFASI